MGQLINIHAAKTHLSRLVEEVVRGADIILAKAGSSQERSRQARELLRNPDNEVFFNAASVWDLGLKTHGASSSCPLITQPL